MKKKASVSPKDSLDATRAQRKRVQNRISQKCHRERQAAHARHLESVVDIIKASDQEGDDSSDRYKTLLRQHMKVIEEKHQLQEVIFRMRKKLLSISNSASAAAADDEAVEALLSSAKPTQEDSQPGSSIPSPNPEYIAASNENSPINLDEQPQKGALPQQSGITDLPAAMTSPQSSQHLFQQLYHVDGWSMSASEKESALLTMNYWTSNSEAPNIHVGAGLDSLKSYDHNSAWDIDAAEPNFPLDYRVSMLQQPSTTLTVTSSTVFAQTILQSCRKYVSIHTSESEEDPTLCYDIALCDWSQKAHVMANITKISAIAVHMLASFAGLESYIYGVGAASVMESIMEWRLMPTYASRISIPEPFRPTPLQYSTNDYPSAVDFINWPSIRDQLILHSRSVNIDEIIRDLVKHTVVDIPQHYVCVNVFSIFYMSILNPSSHLPWNNDQPNTSMTDAQWKFLEIPVTSEPNLISSNLDVTPAESVLIREISRRMDSGSNASSPQGDDNLITTAATRSGSSNSHSTMTDTLTGSWNPPAQRRHKIISRLGLDQVCKWKLSKDFALKHPFLDCSSAVAAYDMVPAQRVLDAEARAC